MQNNTTNHNKVEHLNLPISAIEPNNGQIEGVPTNPRTISETQFNLLVKSIKETPDMLQHRQLMVYDMGNGKYVAVGGNQRLRALQKIGYTEVPVSVIPNGTSAEEIRAMVIKDNASFGDWDMDLLANEWDDDPLEDWGLTNLPMPGQDMVIPSADEIEDDDYDPDQEVEHIAHRGSLFIMDGHRLLCGDSTQPGDWALLMEGRKADLVVTDPPYNVDYTGKTKEALKIANDSMSPEEFHEFLVNVFNNIHDILNEGGGFYVWYASKEVVNFQTSLEEAGLPVRQELIWKKTHS